MVRGLALLLPVLLGLTSIPSGPARPEAGWLTIGLAAAPSGLDPHGYAGSSDATVTAAIFEGLTRTDAAGDTVAGLALSWQVRDGSTWEFTLRQDVVFHDGTPFTSADVVASLARIAGMRTSLRGLATRLQPVVAIEAPEPFRLRLRTAHPVPGLAADLVKFAILRAADAAIEDPQAFNGGSHAIGTGPYRYASYSPDSALTLIRNEQWWDTAPPWRHVTLRFVTRDAARVAGLIAGDMDLIERVPVSEAVALGQRPGIVLTQAPALAPVYVIPNLAREDGGPFLTGPDGKALAINPLRDRRVRHALSLAINRTALTDRLLLGAALPADQFAARGSTEHIAGSAPLEFDLAHARQLMAEAGYGEGLRLVLHGPSDRYPAMSQVGEALAQMWARIGIRTQVEMAPWNSTARRAGQGEFAATLFACCSTYTDPLAIARDVIMANDPTRGAGGSNWGRYGNPALDTALDAGLASFGPAPRRVAAAAVAAALNEDVPIIMLYHPMNIWASRSPVSFVPRKDGQTQVIGVTMNGGYR